MMDAREYGLFPPVGDGGSGQGIPWGQPGAPAAIVSPPPGFSRQPVFRAPTSPASPPGMLLGPSPHDSPPALGARSPAGMPPGGYVFDEQRGVGVCYICGNIQLTSTNHYLQHVNGKAHMKKLSYQAYVPAAPVPRAPEPHPTVHHQTVHHQPVHHQPGPHQPVPRPVMGQEDAADDIGAMTANMAQLRLQAPAAFGPAPKPAAPSPTLQAPAPREPALHVNIPMRPSMEYVTTSVNISHRNAALNALPIARTATRGGVQGEGHAPVRAPPAREPLSHVSWETDSNISDISRLLNQQTQHDEQTRPPPPGPSLRAITKEPPPLLPMSPGDGGSAAPPTLRDPGLPDCIEPVANTPNHFWCTVCTTTISADAKRVNLQQHMQGKSHKKSVERQTWPPALGGGTLGGVPLGGATLGGVPLGVATLGGVPLGGVTRREVSAEGEAQYVEQSGEESRSQTAPRADPPVPHQPPVVIPAPDAAAGHLIVLDAHSSQYRCTLCAQTISGDINWHQHLQGRKHKSKAASHAYSSRGSTLPEDATATTTSSTTSSSTSATSDVSQTPGTTPNQSASNSVRSSQQGNSDTFARNYTVLGELGSGGFGTVYRVKHNIINGKEYAVKKIKTSERKKERARREVQALVDLQSDKIVQYHHCWTEEEYPSTPVASPRPSARDNSSGGIDFRSNAPSAGPGSSPAVTSTTDSSSTGSSFMLSTHEDTSLEPGQPRVYLYIKMELCMTDLDSLLWETPVRDKDKMLHIFRQIVEAVQYIHRKERIHRDLKPHNVFITMDNKIKVGDFGLVKEFYCGEDGGERGGAPGPGKHTKKTGTPSYMAPEQKTSTDYDYRVDLYPLGLILLELIHPSRSRQERAKLLDRLRKNPPSIPSEIKAKFVGECRLAKKLLSHVPGERPDTREVLQELDILCRRPDQSLHCHSMPVK